MLLALLPATALARQEQEPAPPPPAEPAPEAPPLSDAPAAKEAPSAAEPSAEERLKTVEAKLEGMEEPFLGMQSDVAGLKRLKFSGYIQGRYEWHDDANFGLDPANTTPTAAGTRRGTNRFLVRRARLKSTYVGDVSEFVLQIDATGDGVALRDAEASLVLDNSIIPAERPFELKLTVGQFKVPFGFEILQSSGDREMPERSRFARLFPGERDRGVRLSYMWEWVRILAALVNGNSVNDPTYGTFDQTSWKDVVGRAGVDLEWIVFGVSGYWGHSLATALPRAASGMTPATPLSYTRVNRLRLGSDAQLYFDVPALGGLAVRGELVWSRDEAMDFAGVPANPCNDVKAFGWNAGFVQHIGPYLGVVFRYDEFDPTSGGIDDECMAMDLATRQGRAGADKVSAVGGGLLGYIFGNLKATLVYEHLMEQGGERGETMYGQEFDNDTLTFQLQASF